MKQSGIPSAKEKVNNPNAAQGETKQNENRLAIVIIFIAVVGLILFGLQ